MRRLTRLRKQNPIQIQIEFLGHIGHVWAFINRAQDVSLKLSILVLNWFCECLISQTT